MRSGKRMVFFLRAHLSVVIYEKLIVELIHSFYLVISIKTLSETTSPGLVRSPHIRWFHKPALTKPFIFLEFSAHSYR